MTPIFRIYRDLLTHILAQKHASKEIEEQVYQVSLMLLALTLRQGTITIPLNELKKARQSGLCIEMDRNGDVELRAIRVM